jgi:hypothetical protein
MSRLDTFITAQRSLFHAGAPPVTTEQTDRR